MTTTRPWLARAVFATCLVASAAARAAEMPAAELFVPARPAAELAGFLDVGTFFGLEPVALLAPAEDAATEELAALRAWNATAGNRPHRNGFARTVFPAGELRSGEAAAAEHGATLGGGVFARPPSGNGVWAVKLAVEGAHRLRAGLAVRGVPSGAVLWVRGSDGAAVGPVALAPDADGRVWTPSVAGPEIVVEVHLPLVEATPWSLRVDKALQLLAPAQARAEAAEAACIKDATCYGDNAWPSLVTLRRAIGYMEYVDGGDGYICSGGLLNDSDTGTAIPYFLTANHCLSTQGVANTLETFFDYSTSSCNGGAPNLNSKPRVNGATVLSSSVQTDFTLLRLSAVPSGQRTFLGWTTNNVGNGTQIARLSHPEGEPLSYTVTIATSPDGTCPTDEDGRPWSNLAKFRYQDTSLGGTLGGSSGAPQFLASGQVVGQLLGACGPAPDDGCDPDNYTVDGRFDATFPSIASFLQAPVNQGPCVPDIDTLCLDNNPGDKRFKVEVAFSHGGGAGNGRAVSLSSLGVSRGGLFWFFSADNPELLVKVLNGCGLNNRYWVFLSAGTNVGIDLLVTDTVTGRTWRRTNPNGTAVPTVQDTNAIACN
jgi:lysyl endopeptidase